jgi:hypothetical protein
MNLEIRKQLLRGDTKIEYEEVFTATPSKDADRLNPDGWNLAYEDHQLGEVFWDDNASVVFHAYADDLHSSVLQSIAEFMDTVERVAKEQHAATSGTVQ